MRTIDDQVDVHENMYISNMVSSKQKTHHISKKYTRDHQPTYMYIYICRYSVFYNTQGPHIDTFWMIKMTIFHLEKSHQMPRGQRFAVMLTDRVEVINILPKATGSSVTVPQEHSWCFSMALWWHESSCDGKRMWLMNDFEILWVQESIMKIPCLSQCFASMWKYSEV